MIVIKSKDLTTFRQRSFLTEPSDEHSSPTNVMDVMGKGHFCDGKKPTQESMNLSTKHNPSFSLAITLPVEASMMSTLSRLSLM